MKYELRHIAPWRTANISAIVYGVITAFFAILFAPILLLTSWLVPAEERGFAGPAMAALVIIAYPIMGVVFGWIGGLLSCVIYNIVVRLTGGLLLEFEAHGTGHGS